MRLIEITVHVGDVRATYESYVVPRAGDELEVRTPRSGQVGPEGFIRLPTIYARVTRVRHVVPDGRGGYDTQVRADVWAEEVSE